MLFDLKWFVFKVIMKLDTQLKNGRQRNLICYVFLNTHLSHQYTNFSSEMKMIGKAILFLSKGFEGKIIFKSDSNSPSLNTVTLWFVRRSFKFVLTLVTLTLYNMNSNRPNVCDPPCVLCATILVRVSLIWAKAALIYFYFCYFFSSARKLKNAIDCTVWHTL